MFDNIPNEIICIIFEHWLNSYQTHFLYTADRVCKRWRALFYHQPWWKKVCVEQGLLKVDSDMMIMYKKIENLIEELSPNLLSDISCFSLYHIPDNDIPWLCYYLSFQEGSHITKKKGLVINKEGFLNTRTRQHFQLKWGKVTYGSLHQSRGGTIRKFFKNKKAAYLPFSCKIKDFILNIHYSSDEQLKAIKICKFASFLEENITLSLYYKAKRLPHKPQIYTKSNLDYTVNLIWFEEENFYQLELICSKYTYYLTSHRYLFRSILQLFDSVLYSPEHLCYYIVCPTKYQKLKTWPIFNQSFFSPLQTREQFNSDLLTMAKLHKKIKKI